MNKKDVIRIVNACDEIYQESDGRCVWVPDMCGIYTAQQLKWIAEELTYLEMPKKREEIPMVMNTDLKPCPFCGAPARWEAVNVILSTRVRRVTCGMTFQGGCDAERPVVYVRNRSCFFRAASGGRYDQRENGERDHYGRIGDALHTVLFRDGNK